ncbi:MAG: glycosyltransferase [Desulfovibrio sp.]
MWARSTSDPHDLVTPLLSWLRRLQVREAGYDQGGIRDPLDGNVAGEHYAATHFAWCCALRHAARPDGDLLAAALEAMAFHLRTSRDAYAPGNWSYHWDFNNMASVETYLLLREAVPDALGEAWLASLHGWKINVHWAINWVAMRALAHFRRFGISGDAADRRVAGEWLAYVLGSQKQDGGIEDVRGRSLPSQYHAYTACLLHRLSPEHPRLTRAVVRAARWLLAITAPDGESNALGRGQGQIFGYACALYLFRAAATLDPPLAPQYRFAADRTMDLLRRFQTGEGWWPLVLNRLPVRRRAGWYDYHHLSVYNAFVAVWLTLAAALPLPPGPAAPPESGVVWLKDSGLLAVRRDRWFVLFGAGREGAGYATEAGITPYDLFWEGRPLYRYVQGPGPGKYGALAQDRGQEANCWSPLWRVGQGPWQAPTEAAGTLEPGAGPHRWLLRLERHSVLWQRELVLGRHFLEARDKLDFLDISPESRDVSIRTHNFVWAADRPCQMGPTYLRDTTGGVVLRLWGGGPLAGAGTFETAWGETRVLAAEGQDGAVRCGWRLRRGPARPGGRLPGIVCLSWDTWSSLWKRKQRLLFELARSGRSPRTLYVEPSTPLTGIVEDAWALVRSRGDRYRRCLYGKPVELGHGFHLASPLWPWPGRRTFPRLERANHRSWLAQLRRFVKHVRFPDGYVLWLYHPSQRDALDALGDDAELVVFDWTDDWLLALPGDYDPEARKILEDNQREMLCRADVVFAVSNTLTKRAKVWCPEVHCLPNATDPEVFRPREPGRPESPLMARRPALVYLSQITERLDVALVRAVALARPDWTMLLIGPVVGPETLVAPLRSLPNVVLVGPLPVKEAATLAAQADVCLLPHREDALTGTLDPIKLYDYLATGRPIVSTAVAMHRDLAPLVRVASGPRAFIEAVEAALAEPPGAAERRCRAARAHTWARRAGQAADVLERFFPKEASCA